MKLLDIEERYLAAVMRGGALQDVALSQFNEPKHEALKRERNGRGAVRIHPSIIDGGDALLRKWDDAGFATESLAAQIVDLQKKTSLRETIKGLPADAPANVIIDRLRYELDELAEKSGRNDIISAEELHNRDFENTEFIVNRLLPVGLTVLTGAPKCGKSWLILRLLSDIAGGMPDIWRDLRSPDMKYQHTIKCVPVLYYTLEDSVRRCKFRLNQIGTGWSSNFYFREKSGGAFELLQDIKRTKARVIVIDTLGAYCPFSDGNDYSETTRRVREIKEMADTLQVAIIVVHHSRKVVREFVDGDDWTQEMLGSQGVAGAADCLIMLQRKRGSLKAVLRITGRDISDSYIPLYFDNGNWGRDYDDVEQPKLRLVADRKE